MLVDLLKGRRNASAPVADRLAALTGTDIRVWLQGGAAEDRRAALKAYGSAQSDGIS
jgi:plasmid maintenance system antidote protein VapI